MHLEHAQKNDLFHAIVNGEPKIVKVSSDNYDSVVTCGAYCFHRTSDKRCSESGKLYNGREAEDRVVRPLTPKEVEDYRRQALKARQATANPPNTPTAEPKEPPAGVWSPGMALKATRGGHVYYAWVVSIIGNILEDHTGLTWNTLYGTEVELIQGAYVTVEKTKRHALQGPINPDLLRSKLASPLINASQRTAIEKLLRDTPRDATPDSSHPVKPVDPRPSPKEPSPPLTPLQKIAAQLSQQADDQVKTFVAYIASTAQATGSFEGTYNGPLSPMAVKLLASDAHMVDVTKVGNTWSYKVRL